MVFFEWTQDQVARCVIALAEGVERLGRRVLYAVITESDGGAELAGPIMLVSAKGADDRQSSDAAAVVVQIEIQIKVAEVVKIAGNAMAVGCANQEVVTFPNQNAGAEIEPPSERLLLIDDVPEPERTVERAELQMPAFTLVAVPRDEIRRRVIRAFIWRLVDQCPQRLPFTSQKAPDDARTDQSAAQRDNRPPEARTFDIASRKATDDFRTDQAAVRLKVLPPEANTFDIT